MPSRWIGLQNVETSHRRDPITFSIPRSDQREALKAGDLVKLIFQADPPSPAGLTAERMWVEVREVQGRASILDEPVGTAWRWNVGRLEYVRNS
jgi:hypothetical protein